MIEATVEVSGMKSLSEPQAGLNRPFGHKKQHFKPLIKADFRNFCLIIRDIDMAPRSRLGLIFQVWERGNIVIEAAMSEW